MEANVSQLVEYEDPNDYICGYTEDVDATRFFVISGLSIVAIIGACCNIILAYIFLSHKFTNTPPTLYPTFLAILDALICCYYVLLFGIDVVTGYLRIESLFVIYHTYILPTFVTSKITQLAIPYLLIFVTLERFAWITPKLKNFCLFSKTGRPLSVIFCLMTCMVIRSLPIWGLTVQVFPECPDFFRTMAVAQSQWAQTSRWYSYYDFWFIAFIQTLVPFCVLTTTNIIIIKRLATVHRLEKRDTISRRAGVQSTLLTAEEPRKITRKLSFSRRMPLAVRHAVYTTLAIVTSYLCCNSLHLVLTVLERSDSSLLKTDDATKASLFYTLMGDTISAMYMFTSAIRIIIYCKCSPVIKQHVHNTFRRLLHCCACVGGKNKSLAVDESVSEHV